MRAAEAPVPHSAITDRRAHTATGAAAALDKLDTMAQELRDYATRRTARINEAYERLRSARV